MAKSVSTWWRKFPFVSIGTPRPLRAFSLTAGLLAHRYLPSSAFPHFRSGLTLARHGDVRQSAYSCGGSHGLGPDWVVLTVFPINPLEVFR